MSTTSYFPTPDFNFRSPNLHTAPLQTLELSFHRKLSELAISSSRSSAILHTSDDPRVPRFVCNFERFLSYSETTFVTLVSSDFWDQAHACLENYKRHDSLSAQLTLPVLFLNELHAYYTRRFDLMKCDLAPRCYYDLFVRFQSCSRKSRTTARCVKKMPFCERIFTTIKAAESIPVKPLTMSVMASKLCMNEEFCMGIQISGTSSLSLMVG